MVFDDNARAGRFTLLYRSDVDLQVQRPELQADGCRGCPDTEMPPRCNKGENGSVTSAGKANKRYPG